MFRRTFWFAAGAAAGVWATTRVSRALRSLEPDSLALRAADRALDAGQQLRSFALDVRSQMAQREDQLNEALGLHAAPPGEPPPPALPGRHRPALSASPDRTPGSTGPTGKEDH